MLGELHCLNCARHLADLVIGADGRPCLVPPAGQETRPILVRAAGAGARCARCGGRALLERPIGADVRPAPLPVAA